MVNPHSVADIDRVAAAAAIVTNIDKEVVDIVEEGSHNLADTPVQVAEVMYPEVVAGVKAMVVSKGMAALDTRDKEVVIAVIRWTQLT